MATATVQNESGFSANAPFTGPLPPSIRPPTPPMIIPTGGGFGGSSNIGNTNSGGSLNTTLGVGDLTLADLYAQTFVNKQTSNPATSGRVIVVDPAGSPSAEYSSSGGSSMKTILLIAVVGAAGFFAWKKYGK